MGRETTDTAGMEQEMKLKPNWRARLVWTGPMPSEEKIKADEVQPKDDVQKVPRKADEAEDVLTAISGMECIQGQLEKILVNKHSGVLSSGDKRILIHVNNLTIDGHQLKAEDEMAAFVNEGDELYCYARPVESPLIMEGFEITDQAVQVWKGRQGSHEGSSSPQRKKKATFPLPSDATHLKQVGRVVELPTPGLGYLEVAAGELAGERVLFSRNRLYINGSRIKHKDSLADHLLIGDKVVFDMVQAAEIKLEQGENYDWIAVLVWVGPTPNRTEINEEIGRRVEHYRTKVITLDDWSKEAGCTGGILQVTGGSGHMGDRVVFSRENAYVFCVRLNRADLSHILKIGDKVMIELQSLPEPMVRCAVEIKYRASLVYIGPPPKLEENPTEDPAALITSNLTHFLTKRGITEREFLSLVRGQLPPRAPPLGSTAAKARSGPESASVVLPPATIYGRVVELRKPENPASGTEHGLFQIENGPHKQAKAFFNRNCLFCWGYNCAKADLMYLITENDKFCVEIQVGIYKNNIGIFNFRLHFTCSKINFRTGQITRRFSSR